MKNYYLELIFQVHLSINPFITSIHSFIFLIICVFFFGKQQKDKFIIKFEENMPLYCLIDNHLISRKFFHRTIARINRLTHLMT